MLIVDGNGVKSSFRICAVLPWQGLFFRSRGVLWCGRCIIVYCHSSANEDKRAAVAGVGVDSAIMMRFNHGSDAIATTWRRGHGYWGPLQKTEEDIVR